MKKIKANKVFVPGGQPVMTYVNRQALGLERQLKDFLYTGYKLLSITGPTKSGKTVLCRSVVPREQNVWINGGDITSEDILWSNAAHFLQTVSERATVHQSGEQSSDTKRKGLDVGISIAKGGISKSKTTARSDVTAKQEL